MQNDFADGPPRGKRLHGLGDILHRITPADDRFDAALPYNSHNALQASTILAG